MSKQEHHTEIFHPTGGSKFCFLFGSNITKSPSPHTHSQWFAQHNINALYLPCSLPDESSFKNILPLLMSSPNFLGANITMPFKNALTSLPMLKHSSQVECIQAANTLYKGNNNEWVTENTDIIGIKVTIEKLIPPTEEFHAVVLGGGGTAAAAIYVLENFVPKCLSISCFMRSPQKFPNLNPVSKVRILPFSMWPEPSRNGVVCLINTLPPDTGILLKQNICNYYFDVSYQDTINLNYAREHKINYIDGKTMFLEQARESFNLWTGIKPEPVDALVSSR